MKPLRIRSLIAGLLAAAVLATAGCGPSPINGNANWNANGNSNGALTPTPTPVASPSPSPSPCPTDGDEAINKFIGTGVQGDPALEARRLSLNWNSKGCEITLVGAAGAKDNYEAFVKIAENAPSRGAINTTFLSSGVDAPHGCTDGWQQCGDICIPPDQKCNNAVKDLTRRTPTPTPRP